MSKRRNFKKLFRRNFLFKFLINFRLQIIVKSTKSYPIEELRDLTCHLLLSTFQALSWLIISTKKRKAISKNQNKTKKKKKRGKKGKRKQRRSQRWVSTLKNQQILQM